MGTIEQIDNRGQKMKKQLKIKSILTALVGLMTLGLGVVAAHAADYVTLTTVAASVDNTVGQLATVLVDVSLISGIGFIMASSLNSINISKTRNRCK